MRIVELDGVRFFIIINFPINGYGKGHMWIPVAIFSDITNECRHSPNIQLYLFHTHKSVIQCVKPDYK